MTTKKLMLGTAALALLLPASASSQEPQDPGCPPGYFKVSTVDFKRYRGKDKNRNGLVCLRDKEHGRGYHATDDDGTIG